MNTQIYLEASEWLVEFRTGDAGPEDRRAFARWLRTSPEHVRAYLEFAAIWNEGNALDAGRQFDDETLVRAALTEGNVFSLNQVATAPRQQVSAPWVPGTRLFAVAATLLVAVIGASVWLWVQRGLYATEIGEQRSIALADGSHIELNARSKIRIRLTDTERRIDLLDGQAYFHVAKDKARPFIVTSASARVRAVGTQFDVYRKTNGTTVSVVEGTVAVLSNTLRRDSPVPEPSDPGMPHNAAGTRGQEREILLVAGKQAIITTQVTDLPEQPDVAAATAWTQKRLVFQSAPLIDVAEEFNRYNPRRLVIQSPALYDFHITGIFSSTDPAALLRFLKTRPGIVITEREDAILVAHKP